ncbi:MAG: YidC/Oxa1 family membrane protein insertase [Oscillospiraceae bacterium]|jgi:YidC/Oxa1 family membrane protein insertase|nr:YidC/Oxa1 family membrane protein insertase [Oscillospiraceae bacterium]
MFNAIATPFGMLLMFLYGIVQNYGLALLLIAVVIKVLLLPFQMKGKRGMMRQSRLQPKIADLQKRHAANKQKLNEEMAKLYKEEGVNPASGCLWSFIQMPIMIALFYAIRQPLSLMMGIPRDLLGETGAITQKLQELNFTQKLNDFYMEVDIAQFISLPENWGHFMQWESEGLRQVSFYLAGINLADIPNWQFFWSPETDWSSAALWLPGLLLFILPLVSGGAQFISAGIMRKMSPTASPEAAGSMGSIIKFMPLMSVWFGFILPAALSFYWTIGTVLQIGQDIWLTKKYTKILDEEDAEKAVIRKARDAELEVKRLETERKKAEGIAEQDSNTSKRKKKKSDKQDKREKAAEWEKKNAPPDQDDKKHEPGRVGDRKYARGRAYDPERFKKAGKKAKKKKKKDDEYIENENDDGIAVDYIDVEYTEVTEETEAIEDSDDEDSDEYSDDDDGD